MADFIPSSAGEAGGIFAGIVAVSGLFGSGITWLFGRRSAGVRAGAEADEIDASAKLKRTQAKHIQFEDLSETVALLAQRMSDAEHDLRECKTRENAQMARLRAMEGRQRMLAATLRAVWPLDYDIPGEMIELLDRIEAEIGAQGKRPAARRKSRSKSPGG